MSVPDPVTRYCPVAASNSADPLIGGVPTSSEPVKTPNAPGGTHADAATQAGEQQSTHPGILCRRRIAQRRKAGARVRRLAGGCACLRREHDLVRDPGLLGRGAFGVPYLLQPRDLPAGCVPLGRAASPRWRRFAPPRRAPAPSRSGGTPPCRWRSGRAPRCARDWPRGPRHHRTRSPFATRDGPVPAARGRRGAVDARDRLDHVAGGQPFGSLGRVVDDEPVELIVVEAEDDLLHGIGRLADPSRRIPRRPPLQILQQRRPLVDGPGLASRRPR